MFQVPYSMSVHNLNEFQEYYIRHVIIVMWHPNITQTATVLAQIRATSDADGIHTYGVAVWAVECSSKVHFEVLAEVVGHHFHLLFYKYYFSGSTI